MKKRRVIPVVAAGGLIAFIVGQFFSFNLGVTRSDSNVADPDAEAVEEVQPDGPAIVQTPGDASLLTDAKLWLIDVLIDGQDYSVRRVTSDPSSADEVAREPMNVDQIITAAAEAEGDASGTRVRISRTPEAVASAEKSLATALQEAGIADDAIETRQRLVETTAAP